MALSVCDQRRTLMSDDARYAAERVMEPILRRWFAIDLEPVNLWSNAENAAVDLSYALEDAGLLLPIQLVIKGAMSADLKCSCENPMPGAHAQSCPRFGMNP
jgi:hypothetical protein